MLTGGRAYSWRIDEPYPTFYSQPHRKRVLKKSSKEASLRHTTLWYRACTLLMDMWKRPFTLAVLLPLPGLVLCGGGIMAMESWVEDWTELSKSCLTPFGTDSPLGGPPTKGFGEDLIWKPFCSLSDTPFWVITACWVCELGLGHGPAWASCLPVRLEIWSNCWPK